MDWGSVVARQTLGVDQWPERLREKIASVRGWGDSRESIGGQLRESETRQALRVDQWWAERLREEITCDWSDLDEKTRLLPL